MWTQFLNESRSQHKFRNKNLVVLGSKHSGKRSLVDSLFDVSRTTLAKRAPGADGNRMRLRGVTTAIDYAYLNVTDTADPDNRTHSKLEIYMVEEIDTPSLYSQLATPAFLRDSVFVVMLDFTAPWNFVAEVERWVRFILELQRMAQLSIKDLEEMAAEVEGFYKSYREPQFDEAGRLKTTFGLEREAEEELPLAEGVLKQNLRVPLVVCVNKCDLQSQVLREESNTKILVILYHLRSLCLKHGAALVYTSIRNNSNLNVLYEYLLHRAYRMPLRFKPEIANEEAIFVPLGFDNPTLVADSVVKIDVQRSFNEVVVAPLSKKQQREEIVVEEDSKFFEKYINQGQSSTAASSENVPSEREERPAERKKEEVTGFFLNLLQGNKSGTGKVTQEQSQRLFNAEKELIKHTAQVLEKRNLEH